MASTNFIPVRLCPKLRSPTLTGTSKQTYVFGHSLRRRFCLYRRESLKAKLKTTIATVRLRKLGTQQQLVEELLQLFGLRFVPQHLAKFRWELRTLDLCRGHPSFPQRPGILSTAPPERRNRRELLGRANETVVLEDCLCCWMKHSRSQAFVMKKVLFQPIEAYEGKRSLDLKDVNMYHLGAVRYNMLTLEAPFQSLSPLALMTNLCEVRFDKERRHYARLSSAAKQIVEGQVLLDPTKRWPMTQLLRHAWFGGRNKEKREAEADRLFELLRK
ncbi:hypothetical protein QOT17_009676 [Balamuthia mandrillaris]